MITFILNDKAVRANEPSGMVLLEFIRDVACMSGTKEACREGECGACTVLVGTKQKNGDVTYKACASCLLPLGDVNGCHVVTVEGLSGEQLTLVQRLIVEHNASQCGFCTPGIVLSLTGFALGSQTLSYDDAINALDGNICRCTGYVPIRSAANALCAELSKLNKTAGRTTALIGAGVLPQYFSDIPKRLAELDSKSIPCSEKGVLVAGGTDLFVQKPEKLMESEDLCFLSSRDDLKYITESDGFLRVGGAVTIEDFRLSEPVRKHFPALERDFLLHSSAILRNKATLAGNVVNASPIGDASIILLALDARLAITGGGKQREVPLEKFYKGYKKTDLACGELVSEIAIPLPKPGAHYHFEKVSNRKTLDIAAVNSAMRLTLTDNGTVNDIRVSLGGVGPVPMLLSGVNKFAGKKPDSGFAEALADLARAESKPIADIRGSAEYKRLLAGQLMLGHIKTLFPSEAV